MKILELRFKNLNSLYGEWFLDFTTPEFTANGIFAITGPTGAGKSTILDAICLALYGATPRLGRITRSSNELMSRQTGECYAEVTFESMTGRFRCHWSQHRARKKPGGRLAESRHEVADAFSNQILESKKREVARVIEEHTGMDFDRFTRSILLAQGGFAAFLQAKPDERAPVLEQITGTEIYSEISKRVHERHRREREKLELLQAETGGIGLLSDEQEAELAEDLQDKQNTEKVFSAKHAKTVKAIQWLTGIDALQRELASITREAEDVAVVMKSFAPEREKLGLGLKAAELEAEFATLSAKRQQQKEDLAGLLNDEEQLPRLELLLGQQQENLEKAVSATTEVRQKQRTEAVLIRKVRALDMQISERKKVESAARTDLLKAEQQRADQEKKRLNVADALRDAQKELDKVQKYLTTNACDESLITGFAGIGEQLNGLKSGAAEIAARKKLIIHQKKQVAAEIKLYGAQQTAYTARKKEHDAVRQESVEAGHALKDHLADRLLREYRAERDGLLREMVYLRKISDLEADRKKLADGIPCPLCGSREHPFAEGNVPEPDETEQQIARLTVCIKTAEKLERSISELEGREKKAAALLVDADKLLVRALHKKEEAEKDLERLAADLTEATEKFVHRQQAVLAGLQPWNITRLAESDIDVVLQTLSERFNRWQRYLNSRGKIEKRVGALVADTKQLDGSLTAIVGSLQEKQTLLADLNQKLEQLILDRRAMYGAKKTDAEEARLEKLVAGAEKAEKTSRRNRDQLNQQVTAVTTRIAALKTTITSRKTALKSLEGSFVGNCLKSGFVDERSFAAGRMPTEQRKRLRQRAGELDEQQAGIATRHKDRQSRLGLELEKKITKSPLKELGQAQDELTSSLKMIGEEIGAIKQKLLENKTAREKIKQKQVLIEARKKECARWDRVHALIGSADGKKYRNFAQGITFELMVSHANLQLAKMTDRYLLLRDDDQPLELNVVDNYQAGEIRSTKNLSGGESFIVSLSLALGLSKMASRKVRVDSLFLDEGFGTLDEEALETALETLSGLQQSGKLIGIISHVSALKERISTQINVLPVSGGKSMVSGPGCQKTEKMC